MITKDLDNYCITPHILCGGSGTRLWPMSREAFPKQFIPLINNKSLLTCTLERAALFGSRLVCVNHFEHRFLVNEASENAKQSVEQILEPITRNTTAAMACAALLADPEEILLFLPADHYIPDVEAFAKTIRQGIKAAQQDYIVTLGVVPSFPSSAYGYIKKGKSLQPEEINIYHVERFIEKPDTAAAEKMILEGSYLWNAGIFLVKAKSFILALEEYAPDILQACEMATTNATESFGHILLDKTALEDCRSESIDYAVIEKHKHVAVIPFNGIWSDVGSWNAVAQLHKADEVSGNRLIGNAYALDCENVFISAPHRPVVTLGINDAFVIDTPDAVLIASTSHAERVKEVVQKLKLDGANEAIHHRQVARPWGHYDCIDNGERYQVKRITVKPGAALSLQMHHHRAEHWVVVKGTALVTCGEKQILLSENQSTYIPLGVKHRLENSGKTDLEIIEVQSGSYLGEDDIERFEDTYGRVTPSNLAS